MSHAFTVTDEQYEAISRLAYSKGLAPEDLFTEWVEDVVRAPRYYETEDWFRHLGATDEQITEARRIAEQRSTSMQSDEPEHANS